MRKINTLGWICGCCFLLASIQQAHPQALCSKIRFKEGNSKGCVGMIVTLTDDDNTVPDVYFFEHIAGSRDFRLGNRQGQGFDNSHQFNTPGVYAVRGVFGSGNGAQSVDCLGFIEIFENKLPDLRILNCPNRRLFFEVTDFGTFDEVWVDVGDNTQYVLTKNSEKKIHTYANEGTFTVKYQGRFNGGFSNCITESRQVLSANQLPPILLEELSVTNNQIILNVGFSPLVRLELAEKKDNGTFNTVGQVGGSIRTVVLSNRTPENTIYYYQVQTSSHCGSEKMSNQLASVYLKGQAKAQENFLTWQRYWGEGFEKYQLLRDGQVYKEFTDKEKTSFSDTSPFVQCKKVYQYQVIVRLNNGWKITTNLVSLTTSEMISPAPPTHVVATVENNQVRLSWKSTSSSEDKITIKPFNRNTPEKIQIVGSQWTDTKANPSFSAQCYGISVENDCGNSSQEVRSCTVFLSAVSTPTEDLLTWTDYPAFGNEAVYELLLYGENNELLKSISVSSSQRNYTLEKKADFPFFRKYVVKISHADEKKLVAYSNEAILEEKIALQIPEAFTPNGDGLNDVFLVVGQGVRHFHIEIFNRWGHAVFASNSLQEGWNGVVNNTPAPPDVYVYVITATDAKGQSVQKKGTFLLLR